MHLLLLWVFVARCGLCLVAADSVAEHRLLTALLVAEHSLEL